VATALEAPAPTPAPRVVGRYVLYGEIASGGMATVHFGRLVGPAGFSRPVAIKRLHAQFARDPDFVKMFLDEARLAARIAHPNVIPTIDVVAAEEEVFLVMEYVRGVTLAQLARTVRRRGDRIQPLIAIGVVSGMLQGLHAAHEARSDMGERLDLVHRDVSPQNALVGTDGVTRLLDFGVAKATGRLQTTRDGQLKGKLAYMAPEQVRGEAVTPRTDIYAASVVLWEALTGKRLFYANNEANVLAKVLSAEVPVPSSIVPDLPASLDRVVLRGLERDPSKRYASARAMAAEIDACLGVASPTEIGEWVERTAGEQLRETAARIASIERSAAESADNLPRLMPVPGERSSDIPATGAAGQDEPPTYVWGQTTRNERRPRRDSEMSSPESGLAIIKTGRSRMLAIGLGASALAVAVCILLVVLLRTGPEPAAVVSAPAAQAVANHSPIDPPVAASVVPTLNVEDLATADPARPSPPETAAPAAAPKPAHAAGSTAPPSVAVAPTGLSHEHAAADCNPPYTADAKGHIHFKPDCI
jgi:eukaryotic-like serine/threonine-protein kinase